MTALTGTTLSLAATVEEGTKQDSGKAQPFSFRKASQSQRHMECCSVSSVCCLKRQRK